MTADLDQCQQNYYAELGCSKNVRPDQDFCKTYYFTDPDTREIMHVFHKHNQLQERFSLLKSKGSFTIAEIGFSAGLNFLTTADLWLQTNKSQDIILNYVSIEKHPLAPEELDKILCSFPSLKYISSQLLEQYYLLLPAYHRIKISENIYLTLIIGDIIEKLPELDIKVDAWFLEGFTTNNNDEMSTNTIMEIARLSKIGTTFTSIKMSSQVCKALTEIGFDIVKDHSGNQNKVFYGHYNHSNTQYNKRYKHFYHHLINQTKPNTIAVIGAGIAGASCAYSLAQRGYQVTIFEKNSQIAQEASGNYQGVLYGTWSAFGGDMMELSSSAYRYSHNLIKTLLKANTDYQECGVIQLAHNNAQAKRNQQLLSANLPPEFIKYLSSSEIEKFATCKLAREYSGLLFDSGIWLHPQNFVHTLLKHPNINIQCNHKITSLSYENSLWRVATDNENYLFDAVILCNSFDINRFLPELPIRLIKGQTTIIEQEIGLNCVLCGDGYVIPSKQGKFTTGASFDFKNIDTLVTLQDHDENLAKLDEIIQISHNKLLSGKASIRTSPHDYLPIVGPIGDYDEFNYDFAKLTKDKNARFTKECRYLPNLYINTGHGGKGMLTAPFCGEMIADYICGTTIATSESLRQALHPNRLYARKLIKG